MKISANGRILKRNHFWFEDDVTDLSKISKKYFRCDELIIHGNKFRLEGKNILCSMQESIITDLSKDINDLWINMTKTLRNEINRAGRENVTCKFYKADDIISNDQLLNEFANVYHSMYEEKGMSVCYLGVNELKDYARQGRLLISTATVNEKNAVFHSYIYGEGNSRFLHSCSEFRIEGNAARSAMGRANKFLHWNDMIELQKMGIENYDWGGISSLDNPNGIDKFKMAFGGSPIFYYNVMITCSLRLKIWKKLKHYKEMNLK